MSFHTRVLRPAICALLWAMSFAAAAQGWPAKPIRIITPYPPGGATDILARLVAQKMELGQPVLVDVKAGAGGNIGTDYVAKSTPDGYTLLMGGSGPLAINASLYKDLPYDPVKDLQPIVLTAVVPLILVVHPSIPATNVAQLIALLKAEPGKYSYASSGAGTPQHLSAELFKSMTGTQVQHIPYKGTGPAFNDLLAGRVPLAFVSVLAVLPNVKAGKLKALGISSVQRSSAAPDIPTIVESGLPGYESVNWFGLVGPSGMQRDVVNRLNSEMRKILDQPDTRDRLLALGSQPVHGTPEQFGSYIKSEIVKWTKIVRESGATPDD